MSDLKIGISDMAIYVPANRMDVQTIVQMRAMASPALAPHFERAVATTAQRSMRFPSPWEDTATMAAEAAYRLLKANPGFDPSELRFLTVGTETTVDHSKPASSYVQGMLQQAGFPLCHALSSFQVQHACASGTLAMLSVGALLVVAGEGRHAGLVICSDVASYDARTTAEVTQGAGSVALLVEPSPKLLELNLGTIGFCSKDVDDFFRPLGARAPKVKGTYSLQCYTESLELAFRDHCRRRKEDPASVLEGTDIIALHTPFHNMPEYAMVKLLKNVLGLSADSAREYLSSRGFYGGTAPVAQIGNIYSGSLFLCLSFLLADRFNAMGEDIVGKSVLLASYGSGNTMAVLSGRVAPAAPTVLSRWRTEAHLESGRSASWEEYEQWMCKGYAECDEHPGRCVENADGGSFHLAKLRPDGYRVYGFTPPADDEEEGSHEELAEAASVV